MSKFAWFTRIFRKPAEVRLEDLAAKPLREFVYLDEVSLLSLLASQKGEVTDTTSEQKVSGAQLEAAGTAGINTPYFVKTEATSRYQTNNTSTHQTSRKATVQSWFRDFHLVENLRLMEPVSDISGANSVADVMKIDDRSLRIHASDLSRGELVELRVQLTGDPVYRLGTMATEMLGLVDDHPALFEGASAATLETIGPLNKILQRLLAGLIPIRCRAVDYTVVMLDGKEQVVRRGLLAGLGLEERPLEIVGVTEHVAYWKDIRRVLFSDAEFTMLCRVARTGLQSTWTPVKLGELFLPVAPDMIDQINAASASFGGGTGSVVSVKTNELLLETALRAYKQERVQASGESLTQAQEEVIAAEILRLAPSGNTTTGQREAFTSIGTLVSSATGREIEPDNDWEIRDRIRTEIGLPLFPALSTTETTAIEERPTGPDPERPRLLDVEVIAIYW